MGWLNLKENKTSGRQFFVVFFVFLLLSFDPVQDHDPGKPSPSTVRSTYSRRSKVKRCPPKKTVKLIIERWVLHRQNTPGHRKKRTSCSPMWVYGPNGPRRAEQVTYKAPGAPRIVPHPPKHSPSPLPQPKYCRMETLTYCSSIGMRGSSEGCLKRKKNRQFYGWGAQLLGTHDGDIGPGRVRRDRIPMLPGSLRATCA